MLVPNLLSLTQRLRASTDPSDVFEYSNDDYDPDPSSSGPPTNLLNKSYIHDPISDITSPTP